MLMGKSDSGDPVRREESRIGGKQSVNPRRSRADYISKGASKLRIKNAGSAKGIAVHLDPV